MNISTLLTNRLRRADLLHWNTLWLALYIIGIGIFFIAMPKYIDDQRFSYFYGEWYRLQGVMDITYGGNIFEFGIPWDAVLQQWDSLYRYDNVRLGNIIVTLLILLPKWVGSSMCLIVWIYVIFGIFKLTGIDWRRSALIPVSILLGFFGFCWEEFMGSLVYQFNYIIPTAIAVKLLFLLLDKRPGKRQIIATAIFALLLGCWHEGFALPLLGSLILNLMIFHSARNPKTYAACVCLTIGIAWLVSVPGFLCRFDHIDYNFLDSLTAFAIRFIKISLTNWGAWLFAIITIVIGIKKCAHQFISDPLCAILYTGVPFALILAVATTGTFRAAWWGYFSAICGSLYLLNHFYATSWMQYSRKNYIISAICISVGLGMWINMDVLTIKTACEEHKVIESIQNDPDSPVANDWIGTKPGLIKWLTKFSTLVLGNHPRVVGTLPPNADGTPRTIAMTHCIPERIMDFTPSAATRIKPGYAYIYKGELILDPPYELGTATSIDFTFGNNITKATVWCIVSSFKSTADGHTYYRILLMGESFTANLLSITAAENPTPKPTR